MSAAFLLWDWGRYAEVKEYSPDDITIDTVGPLARTNDNILEKIEVDYDSTRFSNEICKITVTIKPGHKWEDYYDHAGYTFTGYTDSWTLVDDRTCYQYDDTDSSQIRSQMKSDEVRFLNDRLNGLNSSLNHDARMKRLNQEAKEARQKRYADNQARVEEIKEIFDYVIGHPISKVDVQFDDGGFEVYLKVTPNIKHVQQKLRETVYISRSGFSRHKDVELKTRNAQLELNSDMTQMFAELNQVVYRIEELFPEKTSRITIGNGDVIINIR